MIGPSAAAALTIGIDAAEEAAKNAQSRIDAVYTERNHLVAALARIFPAGIRKTDIEGWDPEWHGCVYIDLPTGQISYHFHDSEIGLFESLPIYTKEWDGHDKAVVHERLRALASHALHLEWKP